MTTAGISIFSNETLLPVSLVLTLIGALIGAAVTFTNLSNKVERLEDEVKQIEAKYITKDVVLLQFETIKMELGEIKVSLKSK